MKYRPLALFRGLSLAALTVVIVIGSSSVGDADEDPAFATAQRMGRGVNVLGFDGIWDGGTDAPFRLSTFLVLREAGFRHVRINLFGFKYMDADHVIAPQVLDDLDRVLDASIAAGLVPVIDQHDLELCQIEPERCAAPLLAFWKQVSERYAGRYPEAVFEILNEPGGTMTSDEWNALSGDVLALIRKTNPARTVIVAALNSENPTSIEVLALPVADRNIIVTVHYYKPFLFTHQGAPWSPDLAALPVTDWGTPAEKVVVESDLQVIAQWAKAQRRPVYLGEFGVYEAAPMAARARYAGFLARAAESLGWPWAYWQFDHDFALFDMDTQTFVPEILRALIPD